MKEKIIGIDRMELWKIVKEMNQDKKSEGR